MNGLLELKEVTDVANRTWNYVAVGAGRDLQWWKEFFSRRADDGLQWLGEPRDGRFHPCLTEAGIQSLHRMRLKVTISLLTPRAMPRDTP